MTFARCQLSPDSPVNDYSMRKNLVILAVFGWYIRYHVLR